MTSQKGLWKFIGIVKYYRDMWERFLHALECLTELKYGKVIFKQTEV